MIFQGLCSPLASRFALFFLVIAVLGAVSGPLHAADSPALSAWDRVFGSTPKATEADPKEQKSKKAKTSKETPKKQKGSSSTKKDGKVTKTGADAAPVSEQSNPDPAPPLTEKVEASSPKAEAEPIEVNAVGGASTATSAPFWKGLFSGASSSSPIQEGAILSNTQQPSSGGVSTPPADALTSTTPTPPVNEPSNAEPFWKRIFGGASSKQAEIKPEPTTSPEPTEKSALPPATPGAAATPNAAVSTTPSAQESSGATPFWKGLFSGASSSSPIQEGAAQSNTPLPSSGGGSALSADVLTNKTPAPPINEPSNAEPFWKRIFGGASSKQAEIKLEQVTTTEPLKETIPAPATASSKSGSDEEPSFWQKLFGNKPTDQKVGASKTRPSDAPVEQRAVVPATSSAPPTPATLSLPTAVAPSLSTTDTKANFSLATVCEREKCELMVLFDAPINKANVDKFIQSTSSIPAGTAVLLNSTEGDLNSGIRLGQVLRQKYFNTRVGRTQLNKKTLNEIDGQCYSACVLAFAGGVNRRIDPNDKIGIYALRSSTKTINENEMRAAVNNLGIYFDQMGIDRRFVDQMLQVKGTSVSLISLSSAKLLNLDNGTRIVTYPWRMQALDDGLLIILVTEKQATNHFSITLGLTKQSKDKDFRLTVFAKPISGNPNLNQLADYLNRDARLQLAFSNQAISPSLIKPWEATSSGVQTAMLLTDKELTSMSSALEFELDLLQIQNNPYKLDGATIFGTSGLKGALTAIKK